MNIFQVGCVLFAFFTCLTRVSDYKHHPEVATAIIILTPQKSFNKNHFQDVVGGALLGGGLAFLAWSFLLARQTGPVTSATSTTSLLAVSTSRLYSREDLTVP